MREGCPRRLYEGAGVDRMKKKIIIERCEDCPFRKRKSDGRSPHCETPYICMMRGMKRISIRDYNLSIPDWCPLPDEGE